MEPTMWGGATTRSQLQKAIGSLQATNPVPAMPMETPVEKLAVPGRDPTHRLSIVREKEIASNLAFLAATSENRSKVMAVCVEEDSSGEGMTIRIASNTGDLADVTAGFKSVGEVLEKAARRGE